MIRKVLRMGDSRLLQKASPVEHFDTRELASLVTNMLDTMQALHGTGLAAPQIGVSLRVVIFGSRNPFRSGTPMVPLTTLCNPTLIALTEEMEENWEGCLSVPGLLGMAPRYKSVRYTGFDPSGRPIEREVNGFHARVVQHECDHLDGILYPMRMRDFTRFGFAEVLPG